jgi:acetylornithine deacetylase/succinyl-diaminopimelate desuccinylase-like protein
MPQAPPSSAEAANIPPAAITQVENDALGWLQALIRINTTNPPGNELAAAKYLADILTREGIHCDTYEVAPGRGFLVARLSATAMPDPSHALLLMGHLDVVGVDKSKWTVDPFGGVIQGGYLYGRGAIDDKGMTVANLAVLVALKRSDARLGRDVIFLAEDDEETGGTQGMKVVVDKHWDKIAAGFALNEGGVVNVQGSKVQYVGVQVSEKVMANVDVVATTSSGHASASGKDNPIVHLASALEKISAYEAPVQFNSVTRAYFEGLAPLENEDIGKWIRALDSPDRGDHAARIISAANPAWSSMLRDTAVPTMLQAGIAPTVIPAQARAVVNLRMLPGDLPETLAAKLSLLVNDPQVHLEIEPGSGEPAPSSSVTSDLYKTIVRVAGQQFPGTTALPYMSTIATDSTQLRLRSVQAYGLLPFPITDDDRSRMHGSDERLSIDAFHKGLEFLYAVVSDFAVAK